jgi:bifunctional UDP-N-acetylglucosamine pyrophosphorylase/glucosamine-1-phosphate N-acetyltransferase
LLAAGDGTRMKSQTPKMLHQIAGKTLINHVLTAVAAAHPQRTVAVLGYQSDALAEHLSQIAPELSTCLQPQRRGTGDAARIGLETLGDIEGEVLVAITDMPLLTGETLQELVDAHRANGNGVTFLSARVADPEGYGRIVRDEAGNVTGIVEQADATDDQRQIAEINGGIGVFDARLLRELLPQLEPSAHSGELYLTDLPHLAAKAGSRVDAHAIADSVQTEGVNDRIQLSNLGKEFNRRILRSWMLAGVTVIDPDTTWVHADVDLGRDVTLLPGTFLEGATSIGAESVIGPETTLVDVEVGDHASVCRTHASLAVVAAGASVGPYSHLRPGTVIGEGSKVGTFVETKNARLAAGVKAQHLSYIGDAEVGSGTNIGAGVVFANYDGQAKHNTSVGQRSFVGSNTVLIAPLRLGDSSYVAAGSAITDEVAAGDLGVARGRQHNSLGWVVRNRTASDPGTTTENGTIESAQDDTADPQNTTNAR